MSPPAADRDLLDLAVTLADRAGEMAVERFFADDFQVSVKADASEVTDVDLAIEKMIRDELRRRRPGDEVYGEESGATPGTSGRRWIIDPIDGTTYFAHRIPLFTTLIAYEDEYGPAIGVVNEPVAGRAVIAGRGLGCRIRTGGLVTAPTPRRGIALADARVEMVNPSRWPGGLLTALHGRVRLTGHLGGVAGLLTGVLDAIVIGGGEMGHEDLAPLPVIMEEAGCRVTGLTGGPVLSGAGVVMSTGSLHDALLALIRSAVA